MNSEHEAIRVLIAEWVAMRDWAAGLLTEKLGLDSPRDILRPEHQGRKKIADTAWTYRTHGTGVDVLHKDGKGGIDFDFAENTEFAAPDWWRLSLFARRAIHSGKLSRDAYEPLLSDDLRFQSLADAVLKELGMVPTDLVESGMQSPSQNVPTVYRLRIVAGPATGTIYPLTATTRIGRDPNADVFVGNPQIARCQCVLVWSDDQGCHLVDQGWFRPVFVNERQIDNEERVPLQPGDRIRVASTSFIYERSP